MKKPKAGLSRRQFLQGSAAGIAAFTIVPRHVLGRGETPPSEELRRGLDRLRRPRAAGRSTCLGPGVRRLASCDVKFKDQRDNKTIYTDFRRVLERKDIDVVAIATHPGWHALISIAAMEAGKDVLCEKPMTPIHRRGPRGGRRREAIRPHLPGRHLRAVRRQPKIRKIIESGLLKKCDAVLVQPRRVQGQGVERQGEVQGRSPCPRASTGTCTAGRRRCGRINAHRVGGTHRGYWDYEGGGLADMAHHHLDGLAYQYGRDLTAPGRDHALRPAGASRVLRHVGLVRAEVRRRLHPGAGERRVGPAVRPAPAQEPGRGRAAEACSARRTGRNSTRCPIRSRCRSSPRRSARGRKPAGNAERSHRVATIYHLANIAFRCGRPLKFDPVNEQIVGDEEANRLVNQPMRAPWRL